MHAYGLSTPHDKRKFTLHYGSTARRKALGRGLCKRARGKEKRVIAQEK